MRRATGRRYALAVLVAGAILAGCSVHHTAGNAAVLSPARAKDSKLLVIMEENHSCQVSEVGMPYLTSLGSSPGGAHVVCGHWVSLGHGSLHTYIDLADGSDRGIRTDGEPSPSRSFTGPSVFDQAIQAGRTAKVYAESMPHNCSGEDTHLYVARHNPWPYGYDATVRANCGYFDVPLGTTTTGALLNDIQTSKLPTNAMVAPNLEHDAHDGTLAQADAWLRTWIPLIEGGADYQSGRLTVVTTWDEPDLDQTGSNPVQTVILHKGLTGQAVAAGTYNLYSVTRWYEDVAGTAHVGNAGTASDLRAALDL